VKALDEGGWRGGQATAKANAEGAREKLTRRAREARATLFRGWLKLEAHGELESWVGRREANLRNPM
jgi:hypothetical protein